MLHTQVVMDHNGDSRHYFNTTDDASLGEARDRFQQLTKAGYIAARRTSNGTSELLRQFDPTAQETLFIPRLVGG
jgi:tRNA A37 threonylcarbamoyltransferase TsaD